MQADHLATDKRTLIEVPASSTVADFEERLREIAAAPEDADLLLPRKQISRFVGGTAAQLQLLATWRHACPQGRVRIHAHKGSEPAEIHRQLEKFIETDRGTVAASLADVWTRAGDEDLSRPARALADARLETLQKDAAGHMKGRRILGLCLDQSSSFEAPRCFYHFKESGIAPKLRRVADFRDFAKGALSRIWEGAGKGRIDPLLRPDHEALGTLFFELFENTHAWARRDAAGSAYPRRSSVRGIRIEGHGFEETREEEMIAGQPALAAYLDRPALRLRDGRRRLVEATIFDSGPGIAARELRRMERTGSEPDIAGEQAALHRCLKKHFTHARSSHHQGEGLHAALEALSALKAFLWVRSGRLSYYRDLLEEPYDPEQRGREPYLLDWNSGSAEATEMAFAQGSFITALIPITHASEQTSFPQTP